jgi:hypothetical protein
MLKILIQCVAIVIVMYSVDSAISKYRDLIRFRNGSRK